MQIEDMSNFVDGIRFLAGRAGRPFEGVANDLGALNQPDQVAAKIKQLVENLPLPPTLPPNRIGAFQRLDAVVEIRKLAPGQRQPQRRSTRCRRASRPA
jgi:hypothetical protein